MLFPRFPITCSKQATLEAFQDLYVQSLSLPFYLFSEQCVNALSLQPLPLFTDLWSQKTCRQSQYLCLTAVVRPNALESQCKNFSWAGKTWWEFNFGSARAEDEVYFNIVIFFFFPPPLFHARGINMDSPHSVKEHALNCGVGEAVLSFFFSLLCFLMERNLEEA